MSEFQRQLWKERASIGGLRGVIDSGDEQGLKNKYIDTCHKICLSRELHFSHEDKLLDFGCGMGRITKWAGEKVAVAVGVDSSADMVKSARQECPGRIEFVRYDGLHVPFASGYFSSAVSVWVMQHIIDTAQFLGVLGEVNRVLKTGGRFVLIEQVAQGTTREIYPDTDVVYKVLRSLGEYEYYFQVADFKVLKAYPIGARKGIGARVIESRMLPRFMGGAVNSLVKIDLLMMRNVSIPKVGYIDCLFVLEKP